MQALTTENNPTTTTTWFFIESHHIILLLSFILPFSFCECERECERKHKRERELECDCEPEHEHECECGARARVRMRGEREHGSECEREMRTRAWTRFFSSSSSCEVSRLKDINCWRLSRPDCKSKHTSISATWDVYNKKSRFRERSWPSSLFSILWSKEMLCHDSKPLRTCTTVVKHWKNSKTLKCSKSCK